MKPLLSTVSAALHNLARLLEVSSPAGAGLEAERTALEAASLLILGEEAGAFDRECGAATSALVHAGGFNWARCLMIAEAVISWEQSRGLRLRKKPRASVVKHLYLMSFDSPPPGSEAIDRVVAGMKAA